MSQELTYRQATVADLPTLCELGQPLNRLHHQERPDIYREATEHVERDQTHWRPCLTSRLQTVFLAEQEGAGVGFITVQIIETSSPLLQPLRVGRIGSICVLEAQRGQGIGRTLMEFAERWAIRQGAGDLRLTVWAFNEPAQRLYRELGYETRAFEMGKRLD
ncbi:GNAT family N-acetyltransferase [Pseudomonas sp. CCM 7893]|uniref:GNAT family N-acetyltransferase n=1 Tax=Pseudomonas spelaei TaxID=1055469 RepID=A0A6I3W884_9PSED|nr:GNAT family N-acetyltransferase [Pseudomonas spelaei]MUF03362.1 GNAT family N-acetyltransferase [Pseudomonas spelaei]QLG91441.1 GNAT family N-acetyltransferase [Pseudomonas yamanorum]